jgi:hypothetical protein
VETGEPPRDSSVAGFVRGAESRGRDAAHWVGRGDEKRGLALLTVAAGAGAFICLFLPWIGYGGHDSSGWALPLSPDYGLLALAVVLTELLWFAHAWISRSSDAVLFVLAAGAGILGVSMFANLRWGTLIVGGFSTFEYGAWLGLVFGIVLIAVASLRLSALWRPAP